MNQLTRKQPVDVLLVIALQEEFELVDDVLDTKLQSQGDSDLPYYDFEYSRQVGAPLRGVATYIGEASDAECDNRTTIMLQKFEPRLLCLVGMAGKVSDDVHLGDVVVGRTVYHYLHRPKIVSGTEPNDQVLSFDDILPSQDPINTSSTIQTLFRQMKFRDPLLWNRWQSSCQAFANQSLTSEESQSLREKRLISLQVGLFVEDIATGPFVGATWKFKKWLTSDLNRNFFAMDQESHGMLKARFRNDGSMRATVIRGISDPADESKKEIEKKYRGALRRIAMHNALWALRMCLDHMDTSITTNQEGTAGYQKEKKFAELVSLLTSMIEREHLPSYLTQAHALDDENMQHVSAMFENISKHNFFLSEDGHLFEQVIQHIEQSEDEVTLTLSGLPGTGKSGFLGMLYSYAYYKYIKKTSKLLPVFVSLTRYNSIIYDTEGGARIQSQVAECIKSDFAPLIELIKLDSSIPLLVLIDGFADESRFALQLLKSLNDILKKAKHKKIIAARFRRESKRDIEYERELPTEFRTPNVFSFHPFAINTKEDIEKFCNLFLSFVNQNHDSELLTRFKRVVAQSHLSAIDLFTAAIMLEQIKKNDPRGGVSLNRCLQDYCLEYLTSVAKERSTPETTLVEISELAFKWEIHPEEEVASKDLRDHPGWTLLHINPIIRHFLVAKQVVRSLTSYHKKRNKKSLSALSAIYHNRVYAFLKEMLSDDEKVQSVVFKAIENIFKDVLKPSSRNRIVDSTILANLSYLVGRVTLPQYKSMAKELLIGTKLLWHERLSDSKTEDQVLSLMRLLRTTYISLSLLGDRASSEKYVDLLLSDSRWDALNRGFHLEYYGDVPFIPTEPLLHEDPLDDFPNTYYFLLSRVRDGNGDDNLFEIEVHTLFSLAQHRHVCGKLSKELADELFNLAQQLLLGDILSNEGLRSYLRMVSKNFTTDGFSIRTIIDTLSKIKLLPRSGWKVRKIDPVETVGAHVYGAYLLAVALLPHTSTEAGYSKDEIVNLVLAHDLAEAYTGDILPNEVNAKSAKEEAEAISYIEMLGTYPDCGGLRMIGKRIADFSKGTSYNAKVAKDIDVLDRYIQLHIYNQRGSVIDDFDNFAEDCKNKIVTKHGKDILKVLETNFS